MSLKSSVKTDHPLFSEALGMVYCGLTDEEALRLAMRHNVNGHFTHGLTHRDYVEGCRARLYVMAEKDPLHDPTPKASLEWKKACLKCILPKGIVNTRSANIFTQAAFSAPVFTLAMSVIEMFEDGELKGQKEIRTKKQLQTTPDFKQHYFEPLQNLDEEFQLRVLRKVADKELSLKELKEAGTEFRLLKLAKTLFVRCTRKGTWEEAVEAFPQFATDEALKPYLKLNLKAKEGVPQAFRLYCQAALDSTRKSSSPGTDLAMSAERNGVKALFLKASFREINSSKILEHMPTFRGAALVLMDASEGVSSDDLKVAALTTRQINSICTSLHLYHFVVICAVEQMTTFQSVLEKHFDSVEIAFLYDKSKEGKATTTDIRDKGGITFDPIVGCILVGHWSCNEEIPVVATAVRPNLITCQGMKEANMTLIKMYTATGQTVISFGETKDLGTFADAALDCKCSSLSLCSTKEDMNDMHFLALTSSAAANVEE